MACRLFESLGCAPCKGRGGIGARWVREPAREIRPRPPASTAGGVGFGVAAELTDDRAKCLQRAVRLLQARATARPSEQCGSDGPPVGWRGRAFTKVSPLRRR